MSEILLIDFSSILHATFHAEASNPNPDATSIKVLERVRALAGTKPAAICCEGKGNFRKTLDPTYKANRPAPLAELHHQGDLALEALRADGFPVWSADGYEADDVIGTAATRLMNPLHEHDLTFGERTVTIASADKDLLQLVSPRVRVHSLTSGNTLDEAAVVEKLGVAPNQVVDYLALVGDSSDNVKGAKGIGAKGAAQLLNTFGNLDDLYATLDRNELAVKPAMRESLLEFRSRLPLVRQLIRLKTDAPIPFEEVFKERVPADVATFGDDIDFAMQPLKEEAPSFRTHVRNPDGTQEPSNLKFIPIEETHAVPEQRSNAPDRADHGAPAPAPEIGKGEPVAPLQSVLRSDPRGAQPASGAAHQPSQALTVVESLAPAPVEWERQLEPRSLEQAMRMAAHLHASRLFGAYGSPQGVFSTIIAGRELGMDAMASLRAFHIIEGKPTMSAGVIMALVIKSPVCEYFRCTERTNEKATFATKRKGDPPIELTFTVEDGKLAFPKRDDKDKSQPDPKAWAGSGWSKNPADMCVARASSKLARLVYPDVVSGLYSSEEFDV